MEIKKIPHDFSVCQVKDYSLVRLDAGFCFTGKTDEENSLVCLTEDVPENTVRRDDGWKAFRIRGVLDFSLIGILSKIAAVLAENEIPVFAISTYNTDYILLKKEFCKKAQEVRERQERRMRQGERHKDQLPRILRRTMKDSGERTKAQLVGKHAELIDGSRERLDELRRRQRTQCELKIDFDDAQLHDGKLLVRADGLNFEYAPGRPLWREPLALEIRSGERIRLTGDNGTGKTTLVRLLTGELEPTAGRIGRADFSYVCLDQQYSRVNTPQSVLELAQSCNHGNLQDHELKLRLHRALFGQQMWDKRCDTLSGGERMRLCLCSLMIANHVPDLFVLDEPTNNLDLSSLAILTRTVRNYRGTLLVVSHDDNFTREIGITRTVGLESPPAE